MALILVLAFMAVAVFVMFKIAANSPEKVSNTNVEKPKNKSSIYDKISLEVPEGYDYMEIKIAGANFRRDMREHLGNFSGKLVAEPNNEYDPDAIAIKVGRKKMGYVPEHQTDEVREFTGGVLPYDCDGILAESYDDDGKRFYWGIVVIAKEKK